MKVWGKRKGLDVGDFKDSRRWMGSGGYPALALATLRQDQASSAKKQALHILAFFSCCLQTQTQCWVGLDENIRSNRLCLERESVSKCVCTLGVSFNPFFNLWGPRLQSLAAS